MTQTESWHSERLGQSLTLARWGEIGRPVLVFPTAGGDAGEVERFGLVGALSELMADGRVKVYSVDSVAGRSWLANDDPRHSAWIQNQFDQAIRWEVVPAIHADSGHFPIIAAGASIGAFNAVASLCRHPDVFGAAIAMSGTFDLEPWLRGEWSDDFYFSSPLHYLDGMDDAALDQLRQRFVLLATGTGDHENPGESWRLAGVLGSRGIPNRVDNWPGWSHDWPTWRAMLPTYLHELTS
ncbi:MAG TPA: alpha/beta hydrolase-fold protein [Acidimicrobiia bacterium]|nr:alpha/beta hydrolase-fold protein [Acidimicrobiia bacterium]